MYLFIWLHHVLFTACGIYSWSIRTLSCGMRGLVPLHCKYQVLAPGLSGLSQQVLIKWSLFFWHLCIRTSKMPLILGRDKARPDSFSLGGRHSSSEWQCSSQPSLGQLVIHGHFPPGLSPPTPLNKLFQFSARLLPMWSHYLLTKGIPGLNWAPNLTRVLFNPRHLLLSGCVLLQAILCCLLFPSRPRPRPAQPQSSLILGVHSQTFTQALDG